MAMKPERVGSRVPGSATGAGHPAPRTLIVWRVLSALLLLLASALATLFMAGTLLALVLALTVGLFGIHEFLSYDPVPPTLVVESIGTIVLAVTTALLYQTMRGSLTRPRAV